MDKDHRFEIDGVGYIMTPANAVPAWNALKRAARLLKDVDINDIKPPDAESGGRQTSVAIGALLANLGDPAVSDIETLIYEHTNVKAGSGEPFRLINKLNEHLNAHRSHMLRILMEGVKYQFSDFFAGGMASLKGLMPAPQNPTT